MHLDDTGAVPRSAARRAARKQGILGGLLGGGKKKAPKR
jgi:hypothetical protein